MAKSISVFADELGIPNSSYERVENARDAVTLRTLQLNQSAMGASLLDILGKDLLKHVPKL